MYYETDKSPNDTDVDLLLSNLVAYNKTHLEAIRRIPLAVWCKDENDTIIGGVIGNTFGKWLEINYLWVGEVERHKGIGTSVLQRIEKAALKRNCQYAFVDTYNFQARPFYINNGYEEVFTLNEYPVSGKRFYFTKKIS